MSETVSRGRRMLRSSPSCWVSSRRNPPENLQRMLRSVCLQDGASPHGAALGGSAGSGGLIHPEGCCDVAWGMDVSSSDTMGIATRKGGVSA